MTACQQRFHGTELGEGVFNGVLNMTQTSFYVGRRSLIKAKGHEVWW